MFVDDTLITGAPAELKSFYKEMGISMSRDLENSRDIFVSPTTGKLEMAKQSYVLPCPK